MSEPDAAKKEEKRDTGVPQELKDPKEGPCGLPAKCTVQ